MQVRRRAEVQTNVDYSDQAFHRVIKAWQEGRCDEKPISIDNREGQDWTKVSEHHRFPAPIQFYSLSDEASGDSFRSPPDGGSIR